MTPISPRALLIRPPDCACSWTWSPAHKCMIIKVKNTSCPAMSRHPKDPEPVKLIPSSHNHYRATSAVRGR
jgi:hypothetical protein